MPCTRRCLMDTRVKPAYDGSARVARLERAKAGMGYVSRMIVPGFRCAQSGLLPDAVTRRCLMDTRVKPAYDGSARVARLERAKAGMGYVSRMIVPRFRCAQSGLLPDAVTRRCLMDTRVKPAYDGSARVARLERAKAGMGYLSRRHGASPSPARLTPFVTTGLDPVVHAEMPYPGEVSWIRASAPRMTDQHA